MYTPSFLSLDSACRYKVLVWLKKKFPTPLDAEQELFHPPERRVESCDVAVQTDLLPGVAPMLSSQHVPSSHQSLHDAIEQLPIEERMGAISVQFAQLAGSEHGVCVPSDFLPKAASAMYQLQRSRRSYVLYSLAHSIGTTQPGSQRPRFPTDRMPMGLLEYMTNFFAVTDLNKVKYTCTCLYNVREEVC